MKDGRDANAQEPDETKTNKVRTALEDFLTCLGTYCPENFMFTVIKEATSLSGFSGESTRLFN